ncbi:Os02g0769500 [Oryza sativa Japonica Group]|uniref:Os02g0769500 protein n=1 Tax=Oryza sativa subsp. japonica TaxID=39947 RepID=A0A0P0VPY0_ORYSJ|nr:Os02g0769500 [Oryza sativa Japonica Group]
MKAAPGLSFSLLASTPSPSLELADRFHHSALVHRVARPRCRCVPGDWGEVVFPYPDLNWFAPRSEDYFRSAGISSLRALRLGSLPILFP